MCEGPPVSLYGEWKSDVQAFGLARRAQLSLEDEYNRRAAAVVGAALGVYSTIWPMLRLLGKTPSAQRTRRD